MAVTAGASFVPFIVTVSISLVLRFFLSRFIRAASRKLKVDPTRYNFFKNAANFVLFFIAITVIFRSIPALHAYGTGLLTGAGVLAAIVGFASQSAFSNIVSGVFLVIFKPFSVGDRVKIGQSYAGDVEDITLRHTVIKDFENKRVIIPNAVISNETIINSTILDEKICAFVEIAVAFQTDLSKAIHIIQEEAMQHRYFIDSRDAVDVARGVSPVMVRVLTFLNDGILLRAYIWSRNPSDAFDLKCDLNKSIKERFDKEGIALASMQYQVVGKI